MAECLLHYFKQTHLNIFIISACGLSLGNLPLRDVCAQLTARANMERHVDATWEKTLYVCHIAEETLTLPWKSIWPATFFSPKSMLIGYYFTCAHGQGFIGTRHKTDPCKYAYGLQSLHMCTGRKGSADFFLSGYLVLLTIAFKYVWSFQALLLVYEASWTWGHVQVTISQSENCI